MEWIWLGLAVLFQVAGVVCLRLSEFGDPVSSIFGVLTWIFYILAFYFLGLGMRSMDFGQAYAIWYGGGVFLAAAIGILFLGDGFSLYKATSFILIILGIIGLTIERWT